MDGMHDLGGKQGFGPVRYSPDAPAFHAPWEKRVNALYSLAVRLGVFNMDEYRHAIERMEPRHYLSASYYERSLTSLATLCVEKGLRPARGARAARRRRVPARRTDRPGRSNVAGRERFLPGDRVRVSADTSPAMCGCRATSAARAASSSASRRPIPSPTRTRTASRPTTSRPTTSASAPRICGRSSADPALVHVGVFQSYLERDDR